MSYLSDCPLGLPPPQLHLRRQADDLDLLLVLCSNRNILSQHFFYSSFLHRKKNLESTVNKLTRLVVEMTSANVDKPPAVKISLKFSG